MRTRDTQGSFITLIRMLQAQAHETSNHALSAHAGSVPVLPRAEAVASLVVLRALGDKPFRASLDRGGRRPR